MKHVDVAVVGGGQAGLATAHALVREGLRPVVLEASARAAGSWPRYYDSLTVFSPARYCALPGMPFGGDPHRYPHRDEIVEYLASYAAHLDAEVWTGCRVTEVGEEAGGFVLDTTGSGESGGRIAARAVVAASGTFGRPYRPELPGLPGFTGTVLHAAEYRNPAPFAGQRIVVVGSGNSAVQIAVELARAGRVTLASRRPVRFAPQRPLGHDLHFWLALSRLDTVPFGRFLRTPPPQPVIDDGRYRAALAASAPDRRGLFDHVDGRTVTWPDGTREEVDTIVLATGYRPDLPYLAGLGVLDGRGRPLHRDGVSTAWPRLGFVGLEWQRSLSSNSLRGVGRDAARLARRIAGRLAEG